MKNIYYMFVALFLVIGLGSCSSDENEMEAEDTYQLNFRVINYEQISLISRSRATTDAKEPHYAMAIYDAQTNKLVGSPVIHPSGSKDPGTFSASLTKGTYNIIFLAYYTDKALIPEDPTAIQWDAQVVSNTYHGGVNITIDEDTGPQQEIMLYRAVGVFTMNSSGTAVPKNFDHFRIEMQGGSHQLNALTGFAGQDVTRNYTYNSQSSYAGKTEISQSCYAFLPQEECEVDIVMIAEDKDNKTIRKRTFSKVPMKLNQMTRYAGDFFNETVKSDISVKLDEKEWEYVDVNF